MPWLSPDQIVRGRISAKKSDEAMAEQVEGLVGSLAGKRVGITSGI